MKYNELTGKRFNKWTVLHRDHETTKAGTWFWCECDCGNIRSVNAGVLVGHRSKRCRECWSRELTKPLINGRYWTQLVSNANKRGLAIGIDRAFASQLLAAQKFRCALSGMEIHMVMAGHKFERKLATASLDRKDSSKGYTPDNVQWVHKIINEMKMDRSDSEMIRLCTLVYEHSRGKAA